MGNVIDLDTIRQLRASKDAPPYEPDFAKVLTSADDLGAVLRAHLYAEYRLGLLIGAALGTNAPSENQHLIEMISLAQNKQIIEHDTSSALRALNKLRNEFAHQIDFEVTPARLKHFVNCLQGVIRDMYDESLLEVHTISTSPGRERQLLRLALCAIDSSLEEIVLPF